MPVWQKGMELAERVFALTETLPKKGRLRLDLSNPAVSAIRSGQYCRRLWPKTHLNFYYMSRGSLAETKSHLIYGFRVGYFQESELSGLLELIANIWEELNKLINSFTRE
jgi:four helix bundle protein